MSGKYQRENLPFVYTLYNRSINSISLEFHLLLEIELAYFMGIKQSKIVRKHESKIVYSPSHLGKRSMGEIRALYKAALKGDWDAAKELLANRNCLIRAPLLEGQEIALHIAAVEGHHLFVTQLLEIMDDADVEITNAKGCTALCFAAAGGHTAIARTMVKGRPNLPTIKGEGGIRPLYMAALQGFDEMAEFLYPLSHIDSWTLQEQIDLLTTSIESDLYGLAKSIVEQHKTLAIREDANGETPLQVLARKRLVFSCNKGGQGLWITFIRTVLPYMKSKTHDMNAQGDADAYKLFDCLWNAVESCNEDIEAARAADTSQLLFIAAESGNDDFLVELLKRDHNLLYKINEYKHSIFHIAVMHRYVKIFNLMYELGGTKDLILTYIDTQEGNNILHMAGKLAPKTQLNCIPGAALQMQREVLWYKEVEKLVAPSCRNKKNLAGQTPHELFLAEHENLMKEGEKFMKQTAKACMLVTMLIATVVFTTAFTVPGGYDNSTGTPILENKKMFMIFPVSEAVATLSSLISMLMFLSILTSRYSDEDFLKMLPFWLVVGVAALFFSIVAMMVAFCSCLLFFEHGWAAVTLLLVLFAIVPTMFVILKYPLLVTILRCTYSCRWLFRSHDRLHS